MDSVHGDFNGTVAVDEKNKALIINGTTVHIISANAPEDIDYTKYGINNALVIDNTGAFRDDVALSRHLKGTGVSKVLLTAPGKGIPNIVHGANHLDYDPNEVNIFSAASCTTNAITPVLKAIENTFGVNHRQSTICLDRLIMLFYLFQKDQRKVIHHRSLQHLQHNALVKHRAQVR